MQYLRMPINHLKPTAGYRSLEYREYWGFAHFGIDCVSANGTKKLYGLGEGTVKLAGLDGCNGRTTGAGSGCGYVLIIVYTDCYNWRTKKTQDLTVTYMHMAQKPLVKKGDKVDDTTLLGYYGNTGACTTGAHLHMQVDTDTKYYAFCSGVSSTGHNMLKHGTVDSTVNPCDVIFRDVGQTVSIVTSKWFTKADFTSIPAMPGRAETAKQTTTGNIVIG